jgi:tetratricopeptide (TPR) repeat protein
MKYLLQLTLTAGICLGGASAAIAQEKWDGKTIIVKKAGIKIGYSGADGKQEFVGELAGVHYPVLADSDGWLKVKDERGNIGWFDKTDAVLLDNAVAHFSERIRQNSNDAAAYNSRALAFKLKGDPDSAIKDFAEVLRLDPKAYGYTNRGLAWSDKKAYDKAIADYTEAIKLDPKYVAAYNNRGSAWNDKKDYDKAIADFTEAIKLDPKYVVAYSNRGSAWSDKKEFDKAIADYTEAIKLDPKYINAYNNRGSAWSEKKEFDKALADYDEVLKLDPAYEWAYYNKACLFAMQRRADPAFENLRKAFENGFRDFEHMEKDGDLETIRKDPRYKQLLEKFKKKPTTLP